MSLNKTLLFEGKYTLSQNMTRQALHSIRQGVALEDNSFETIRITSEDFERDINVNKAIMVSCSTTTGFEVIINDGDMFELQGFMYLTGAINVQLSYLGPAADIVIIYA